MPTRRRSTKGVKIRPKQARNTPQPKPKQAKRRRARRNDSDSLSGSMSRMSLVQPRYKFCNESDFVKLVLDPCNGPLTCSPFGASENGYLWRVNARFACSTDTTGNLLAVLYPLGAANAGVSTAPSMLQVWTGYPSDTATSVASTFNVSPPALATLKSIAAQVKVVAGCVKLKYTGAANVAAGEMFAWEGQGDETFGQYSNTAVMLTRNSFGSMVVNAKQFPITAGAEAMLNYGRAPPPQLGYFDPNVNRTDVYCPIAYVGVSGGPPGGAYVVESTLIVEWTPLLGDGIPNENTTLFKPGAAERVANSLKMIAPLLVRAGKYALGGYAGMLSPALEAGYRVGKALMS